jgi:hypothetical protein
LLESKISIPGVTPSAPAEKKSGFSLWGLGEALVTNPFAPPPAVAVNRRFERYIGYQP